MKFFNKLARDEQGATAIEYGLIAALIAVAAVTAMQTLGSTLDTVELALQPDGQGIETCRVEPLLRYEDLTPERFETIFTAKLVRSLGPPSGPWPEPKPNLTRRYWRDPVDRGFTTAGLRRSLGYFHRFIVTFYPERVAALKALVEGRAA